LTVSSEKGAAATDAVAVTVPDPAKIAIVDAMYHAKSETKAEVLIRHVANAVVKIIVADFVPNQRVSNAVKRNVAPNQEANLVENVDLNQEANLVENVDLNQEVNLVENVDLNQEANLVENTDLNQEANLVEEDVVVAIMVSI